MSLEADQETPTVSGGFFEGRRKVNVAFEDVGADAKVERSGSPRDETFWDSDVLKAELDFISERKPHGTEHISQMRERLGADSATDAQQGKTYAEKERTKLVGLAFSGGGIRSATFCLGVMQRLHRANIFQKIDYLSTVSGGGYTGSALAWWLSGKPFQDPKFSLPPDFKDKDYMPYGNQDPDKEDPNDRKPLMHLRRNANYLIPGEGINLLSGITVVLRAIFLNLLVWIPLVTTAFMVMLQIGFTTAQDQNLLFTFALGLSAFLFILIGLCSVAYSLSSWSPRSKGDSHNGDNGKLYSLLAGMKRKKTFTKFLGYLVILTAITLAIYIILGAYNFFIYGLNWQIAEYVSLPFIVGFDLAAPTFKDGGYLHAVRSTSYALQVIISLLLCLSGFVFFLWWSGFFSKGVKVAWRDTRKLFSAYRGFFLLVQVVAVVLLVFGFLDIILFFLFVSAAFSLVAYWVTNQFAVQFRRKDVSVKYSGRRAFEEWAAVALKISLALLVFGIIPWVYGLLNSYVEAQNAGAAGIVCGIASAAWGFLQSRGKGAGGQFTSIILRVGAALFIFGVLMLGFALARELLNHVFYNDQPALENVPSYFWGLLLVALFSGHFVNLNYISLGRFYRDRLMEAFMPDWNVANADVAAPAGRADAVKMSQIWEQPADALNRGPYPLINTNVVLVNSKVNKYRQRGGDNFMITPFACGSNATGWRKTLEFDNNQLTLATAMAVSGAAANPRAGIGGKGATMSRTVSTVMTLLNFRLGYWVNNPDPANKAMTLVQRPSHYYPSAIYSLSNKGYQEDSSFLELSDGGHFENLALYELIRRRTRLIFACDGGQDALASYGDFVSLLIRAREDFGANFEFVSGAGPELLVPMPDKFAYPKGTEYANQGFFIATINYGKRGKHWPGAEKGIIIYMKTSMIEKLSMTAKGYRGANRDFPDQSTGDQFFDPEQFEAYREVGYRIAEEMIKALDLEKTFKSDKKRPDLGKAFYDRMIRWAEKTAKERNPDQVIKPVNS